MQKMCTVDRGSIEPEEASASKRSMLPTTPRRNNYYFTKNLDHLKSVFENIQLPNCPTYKN